MDTCQYHTELCTDIATIKTDISYIKDRVCSREDNLSKHVAEGEAKGGYRDRVIILELEVSALKKAEWRRVIVAGFIGGLISQLTPEVFGWIIKMVIPH